MILNVPSDKHGANMEPTLSLNALPEEILAKFWENKKVISWKQTAGSTICVWRIYPGYHD